MFLGIGWPLYPVTFQHLKKIWSNFSGYLLTTQDGVVKKTL